MKKISAAVCRGISLEENVICSVWGEEEDPFICAMNETGFVTHSVISMTVIFK
jgi:hypothetical protein